MRGNFFKTAGQALNRGNGLEHIDLLTASFDSLRLQKAAETALSFRKRSPRKPSITE